MQKRDILIVGQGLAGSLLALELEKRGKYVMILDNNPIVSSSKSRSGFVQSYLRGVKWRKLGWQMSCFQTSPITTKI